MIYLTDRDRIITLENENKNLKKALTEVIADIDYLSMMLDIELLSKGGEDNESQS